MKTCVAFALIASNKENDDPGSGLETIESEGALGAVTGGWHLLWI